MEILGLNLIISLDLRITKLFLFSEQKSVKITLANCLIEIGIEIKINKGHIKMYH